MHGEYRRSDAYELEENGDYVEWPVEREWRTWRDAIAWSTRQQGGENAEKNAILHWIIEAAQEAKESCSQEESESLAAVRNGKLASIAQAAAQALGLVRGPSFAARAQRAGKEEA
jgi:hypothetical protein